MNGDGAGVVVECNNRDVGVNWDVVASGPENAEKDCPALAGRDGERAHVGGGYGRAGAVADSATRGNVAR